MDQPNLGETGYGRKEATERAVDKEEVVTGEIRIKPTQSKMEEVTAENRVEPSQSKEDLCANVNRNEERTSGVLIVGDVLCADPDQPRPRMTTSNSGAEIMLGLETDDGKTAEVEIDSLDSDSLQPEEVPKGRVRKTSIVDKLSKSKESELIALSILENAGQRQREFEKLINEHQELVQVISRTPSTENIAQSVAGRNP